VSYPVRTCLVKAPGIRPEPGAVPVDDQGVPRSHHGYYERAPGCHGAVIVRGFGPDYDGPCTVWNYSHGGHAVLLPVR
jgi:hypothetical protein